MIGPRFGPPPFKEQKKPARPKNIKEFFGMIGAFFSRLFYIVRLVWETNPWILILLAFFCVADGLLPVLGAYISKDLLNAVSGVLYDEEAMSTISSGNVTFGTLLEGFLGTVVFLLIFYFVYQFLHKLLTRLSSTVKQLAGDLVCNHIKLKIIEKAKTVDLASFDRPEFYEKLENANREAGMRPIGILNATFSIFSALLSIVSFAAILVTLHPLAPIVIAIMALPGAILTYVYRNKQFRYVRHRSKERRQMEYFSTLVVNKDMVKEVRIMDLADTFIGKYKAAFRKYFAGMKRLVIREGLWQIFFTLISLAAQFALFTFIVYRVIGSGGEIGDYSLYTGALASITSGVATLVTSTASVYEGTLFIDNMMVFMKEEVTIVPVTKEPRLPARHAPHTIEFKNVSFAYPGTTRKVIKNVNMTFHAGENVVLVGLNGAGKTTLIKLLTRLYDPTEGAIYLDGVDLREYDVRALYDIFGIIFQDFGKYAVSLKENIAYGDVHAEMTEERIRDAANKGNAADYIEKLPEQYETPLMRFFEENGMELSIGQWQKLSIARAFYKDSDILILDEPTAALDPLAEQEVFNRFSDLGENKISVFVSHRLSSATRADKIVVLEDGAIAEIGTHAELMKMEGKYHHLFSTQAQHYVSSNGEEIKKA
ncbi:MAG: ABC transporter ATP-binding protein [Ruminococcaceae bacterium]|nr:ABC transporter ATP-binding protein [Oscillospiraceae bacterium]